MPDAVESFPKVNKFVDELTLVLQLFLNDDSAVEDLFHFAPPSSESSLLFGQQFLSLTRLKMLCSMILLG
ncbi:hypothetical protein DPMN_164449 [Dreissena polymorpha]|uniref:Uncharacterized protein n=1 Tax=Dreissena polymorpha TaxID=45954 RepID=A0A9D4EU90_DREPO|nr:hypothetical protein DPMN_164449 [Dreissena polymorpha]